MACRARLSVQIAAGIIVLTGCSGQSTADHSSDVGDPVATTTTERVEQPVAVAEPTTSSPSPTTTTVVEVDNYDEAVFAFPLARQLEGWSVVNDTVMGGVSTGELAWVDTAMVFTGELSLENNGGFASVRSPFIEPSLAARWADRGGLRLELRGDGRSWAVQVRTSSASGGWIASVTPPTDDFALIEIPWTDFEPVTRFLDPRQTDEVLDPSEIALITLYLIDGVEERFRLEVRSID